MFFNCVKQLLNVGIQFCYKSCEESTSMSVQISTRLSGFSCWHRHYPNPRRDKEAGHGLLENNYLLGFSRRVVGLGRWPLMAKWPLIHPLIIGAWRLYQGVFFGEAFWIFAIMRIYEVYQVSGGYPQRPSVPESILTACIAGGLLQAQQPPKNYN